MRTKEKFYTQDQFFQLFDRFIRDTSKGKRMRSDGKIVRSGTIDNYIYCRKLLQRFTDETGFELKLHIVSKLKTAEKERATKYWNKFFGEFTDFLYFKLDFYDNYVGTVITSLRTFFSYLNKKRNLGVGNFHLSFYTPHENIPILALSTEQLQYIIYDEELNQKLPAQLRVIKDLFVFGCTVALRQSDLMRLTPQHIHYYNDAYYLKVDSQKTDTHTTLKLPSYALDILKKYHRKQKTLLPVYSKVWLNKKFKELARYMDFKEPMIKYRTKKGKKYIVYKDKENKTHYTLADHITTHTMRRTAITNLLRMNVPEQAVRSISGHAPGSKEFYRYVKFAQNYIDEHTDQAFEKMRVMKKRENIFG